MNKTVAVITGATGGIGRAIAERFAGNGYALVLSGRSDSELQKLAGQLRANNKADCITVAGDLESDEFPAALCHAAAAAYGTIDILVNNAAWRTIETMRTISEDNWNKTIKVCLTAPAFLSRAAAGMMEKSGRGGCIINVSTVMSWRTPGYCPAYVAAKAGMEGLTRELAVCYGRSNIRVVGISPGMIDTALGDDYKGADGTNVSSLIQAEMLERIPAGRAGNAAEVAALVSWLGSPEAAYLSGTTITLDGGFSVNFNSYSSKHLQFPGQF